MNKLSMIVAAFAVLIVNAAMAADKASDSLETVSDNLAKKKAVLVDVREENEWRAGFIKDSVHIPLSMLTAAIKDPAKEANEEALKGLGEAMNQILPKKVIIYTYCASGVRSVEAAKILGYLGYDVRPLKPGFKDLAAAGFPTASAVKPQENPKR